MSSKSPTGPAGPLHCACRATAQTMFCLTVVFLCPTLSWSATSGVIPHRAALASTYLIKLISD